MIPTLRPLSNLPSRLRFIVQLRPFSSTSASNNSGKTVALPPATVEGEGGEEGGGGAVSREEAYRRVHDLDFMTAIKILVTTPPKRKQFGLDFHLVQLFFACMPSLAVYLVAQYARYEIRRMEAEAELKKKQAEEEEEKAKEEEEAKEAELQSMHDAPFKADLSKVIVRLDALEEVVKEIADDKKRTGSSYAQVITKAGELTTENSSNTSTSSTAAPSDDDIQKNIGKDR